MNLPIFNPEEYKIWMKIPENEKREILDSNFSLLLQTARKQLAYIEECRKTSSNDKEVGHIYVFNTIQTYWDNLELLLFLGQSKFANFAFYPARTCNENFLQFYYFCKQDQNTKNDIAIKELLRSCVRYYLRERNDGQTASAQRYTDFYRQLAPQLHLPPIEDITDKTIKKFEKNHLKSFPGIERLCVVYNQTQAKIIYFLYQYLCEDVHGSILSNVIRDQSTNLQEYRRALMLIYMFSKDILVLMDRDFLESRFKDEVTKTIKQIDNTFRSSINT